MVGIGYSPWQLLQADGFLCFLTCLVTISPSNKCLTEAAETPAQQAASCPSGGGPSGEVTAQGGVCPEHRAAPGSAPLANAPQHPGAQRGPAGLVLLCCLFAEGRAAPTTTGCLLPFVRALMHLMMNSQPFEKGLCLPETRTKYYKLKIAASLWNMPTSPTEYSVECKFASICIHIHNFHLTHQPCSIKMHCLTL